MNPAPRHDSGWSFQVARVLDIPIRIHFTFLLILVWAGWVASSAGGSVVAAIILLLLIFLCVVLHELGHAVVAKRFGVATQEIVLYPLGGVARLDSMPSGKAELMIAIAGPLVNLAIAVLMLAALLAFGRDPTAALTGLVQGKQSGLAVTLLAANALLFGFNLLPAFPMDGGRVLRALLSLRLPEERATDIAAAVGQAVAIAMFGAGLLSGNILLVFIAFFVFLGAGHEAAFHRQRAAIRGRVAREAMITRFETLAPNDTLAVAAQHLLATHQQDFPVIDAWGRVAGLLTRSHLLQGLAGFGPERAVLEVMVRDVPTVAPDESLETVLQALREAAGGAILVMEGERLAGMITLENLSEFMDVVRSTAPAGGAQAAQSR